MSESQFIQSVNKSCFKKQIMNYGLLWPSEFPISHLQSFIFAPHFCVLLQASNADMLYKDTNQTITKRLLYIVLCVGGGQRQGFLTAKFIFQKKRQNISLHWCLRNVILSECVIELTGNTD